MADQVLIDPNSVSKAINVQAAQEIAWRVFTEKMGTWRPLGFYKIGKANAIDAVMEPWPGGAGMSAARTGAPVSGEPCWRGSLIPASSLSWDMSADWQPDPTLKTEIGVRFAAHGNNATRVELEHRRLDRYGARRDEMRRIFDTEGDWGRLLAAFAQAAEKH